MLAHQQTTSPTSPLSGDYPCLVHMNAAIPPPSPEDARTLADAYSSVAAVFLSTAPQEEWTPEQKLCVENVKLLRKAVPSTHNTLPHPFDPWWKTYFAKVSSILVNAEVKGEPQLCNWGIKEFCETIQLHKDVIKRLKSRKFALERKLIELLDGTYSPDYIHDPSLEIDGALLGLDELDRQLIATQSALARFAGV